jgi:hypothetical protein
MKTNIHEDIMIFSVKQILFPVPVTPSILIYVNIFLIRALMLDD